jgi:uncharacterized membrane protein YeaQ/YmgE (transglycosylase-associated protein family)
MSGAVDVILFGLLSGGIGVAIGAGKGRARLGFVLGMFLGVIGWVIIAFLKPTPAAAARKPEWRDAEYLERD